MHTRHTVTGSGMTRAVRTHAKHHEADHDDQHQRRHLGHHEGVLKTGRHLDIVAVDEGQNA